MKAVAPSLFYRGIYEYRVVKSNTDGRLDIEPTDPDEELSENAKFEVWAGIAGYKVKPVVGTIVLVAFVKGNLEKPRVVGFCPLNYTKPVEMQIDGDSILFGTSSHKSVTRDGDEIATFASGTPMTVTMKNGSVWSIAGTVSGGTVTFAVTPVSGDVTDAGKLKSWSNSKVRAQ
jgi:hypothetical protein